MRGAALVCALLLPAACGFLPWGPVWVDPSALGPDGRDQGEYHAEAAGVAVQVVALGGGRFEALLFSGGLPGAGWDGSPTLRADGLRREAGVELAGAFTGWLGDGRLRLGDDASAPTLPRVTRESPTLGAPAPPGAQVLFDARGAGAMEGERDALGFLTVPARSLESFDDFRLHLEFRTPFMPESRAQGRGNSGVYLQDRYEVQILDSFGALPAWDGCGAVYRVAAPRLPMAFPPLQWQTYDIEFRAARFDADGKKLENARLSLDHNGVRVHDALELPGPTGLGDPERPRSGPVVLQSHGSPVAYRNLWILPR